MKKETVEAIANALVAAIAVYTGDPVPPEVKAWMAKSRANLAEVNSRGEHDRWLDVARADLDVTRCQAEVTRAKGRVFMARGRAKLARSKARLKGGGA